jgi:predicted adenylyl cyclase CyaB
MAKNIEVKAYGKGFDAARKICEAAGAKLIRGDEQTDTYFNVAGGARLKLRRNSASVDSLIWYDRLNSPELRESAYEKADLDAGADGVRRTLEKALGAKTVVKKRRDVYAWKTAIVNIDSVEGIGDFVEIEVDVESSGGEDGARAIAEDLKGILKIDKVDILPFSYSDMVEMYGRAAEWRAKLRGAKNPGSLFLIDGASCSGKTTLAHDLMNDPELGLAFVPRYCTREKRDQATEDEYIFVSHDEFAAKASGGEFIEFRDFLFGMSYGLPWDRAVSPLLEGRSALGIIDLGSVRHVGNIFPEAVTILVHAPMETLRKRMIARGLNKEEQIEERLGNARTVELYLEYYNHVVENEDGALESARAQIMNIVKSKMSGKCV